MRNYEMSTGIFSFPSRRVGAALLLLFLLANGWAADVPKPPSTAGAKDFDLQGFISKAIQGGAKQVIVPAGRYRVTPSGGHHLFFKDLADVEIVADGVEMICTQTVQAVGMENCRNVHLRGLTVDYDPLPFTEGRITALAPDKSWVEFEIIAGYPENALEERVEIYDPQTQELRRETAGWSKEFKPVGNHRYRIAKHTGYHFNPSADTERVGDILVTNNVFPAKSFGHAISLAQCTGVKFENVTVFASPCFGFIEDRCDGSTYLRCKIDRRAPQEDPVKRAFARLRSLDADAFHSIGAAKGPAILECTAKFQGDDCVNIHGGYHLVTGSAGSRLRVAATGRMTIEPGDPVEFLPYAGERPADAVAVKIEPDAGITAEEKAFFQKLNLNDRNKRRLLGGEATFYAVTLDRAVPLAMGSAVCSSQRVGNGFVVKGCDFGYNRSRGILIKASHGEVSGNKITNGWMAAVLVAPEFWWSEAASASDVTIKDNIIIGCRRPAIEVTAKGGNGQPLPSGAHRDLRITGNTFTQSVWPNIHVASTSGLLISDNHPTPNDPANFVPPLESRWNWQNGRPSAIVTEFCEPAPGPNR
ncbi:MAG: right-handed parallel beta-helix repeat-containing protein [Chthoniobacter sp.]|uniref:right-handed parallel beta-helix repeat-containing protein n=1 Tax=Chthoniobacter sp. TaxID=2510640 RepID=UPI0032AD47CB